MVDDGVNEHKMTKDQKHSDMDEITHKTNETHQKTFI